MFENPRSGRQARNFTTNVPKILVLKSSSEQIFSRKLPLGAPVKLTIHKNNFHCTLVFPSFFHYSVNTCENITSAATAVITTQMISSRPDRVSGTRAGVQD